MKEFKYMFYSPNWQLSNPMSFDEFDKLKHNYNQTVEVMTYFGKLDKEGHEIYTGHIVLIKWNNSGEDLETVAEVKYSKEAAAFIMDDHKRADFGFYSHLEIEIIGNIYQNSWLLAGQSLPYNKML